MSYRKHPVEQKKKKMEDCVKNFMFQSRVISPLYNTEGCFNHLGHKVKELENGHTVDASVKREQMIR